MCRRNCPRNKFLSGIPPGTAILTFGEETGADVCVEFRHIIWSPAYNIVLSIMKRRYVEPVKAPQLRLGNLGSFGN
jgi:hypothetical protein